VDYEQTEVNIYISTHTKWKKSICAMKWKRRRERGDDQRERLALLIPGRGSWIAVFIHAMHFSRPAWTAILEEAFYWSLMIMDGFIRYCLEDFNCFSLFVKMVWLPNLNVFFIKSCLYALGKASSDMGMSYWKGGFAHWLSEDEASL